MRIDPENGIHVEAEQPDVEHTRVKAGFFCLGLSAAIVGAGFIWLGHDGMLDPRSTNFFPLPHFFAVASAFMGLFFLARGSIHGRRFQLFGVSSIDGNVPMLGETFKGTLRVTRITAFEAPIALRLSCAWRPASTHTANSGTRALPDCDWETSIDLGKLNASGALPFRFDIPADGLPSGRRPTPKTGVNTNPGTIVWTLAASSPRRGIDYLAEFEIRVLSKANRSASVAYAPREASPALLMATKVASAVFGGTIPTADELAEEAEAESRPEPARPFASSPQPKPDPADIARKASFVIALLLCLFAAASFVNQVTFGGQGHELPASVTRVARNEVTLDFGAMDPAHTIYVSSFHHWTRGQSVTALCESGENERPRCRMTSGFDRWLNPIGLLAAALLALMCWRTFAMRRKQRDTIQRRMAPTQNQ